MPGRTQRIMRVSTFNIIKRIWKPINIISEDLDTVIQRVGHTLLWDNNTLLILGGSDISHSASSSEDLVIQRLDFKYD